MKVAVIVRVAPAGTTPSVQGKAVVQSPAFDTHVSPGWRRIAHDDVRGIRRPGVGDGDRVDERIAGDDRDAGPVLVIATSASVSMASWSVAIAEVRFASPAGGTTWAELTSSPVAAGLTVPVAVKTTLAPTGTVTGVLMWPLPDAGHAPPAVRRARPRDAGQRQSETCR